MNKIEAGTRYTYVVRAIYALSTVAIIVIPYMLKDQLSWPWIAWSILGLCVLSILVTFAKIVYYGFIDT
jgi:drug/metabolite transporter (DMT)-like permease